MNEQKEHLFSIPTSGKNFIANYELNNYSYNSFWKGRKYEHLSEIMLIKRIVSRIQNHSLQSLLDIGGAYGRITQHLLSQFASVILADYSTHELTQGREQLGLHENLEYLALNAYNIPLKDKSIDNVMSIRLIHHLSEPSIFFEQVYRILKPGGYFILEAAHKMHILGFIKAFIKGNLNEFFENKPNRIQHNPKHSQGIKDGQISIIYSFPKQFIIELAEETGFIVEETIPCSFFRHAFFKKILPLQILLFLEGILQRLTFLAITPSVFYVLRKGIKIQINTEKAQTLREIIQCPLCGEAITLSLSATECSNHHRIVQQKEGIIDLRDPRPEEVIF